MEYSEKERARRELMEQVGNCPFAGPLSFFRQRFDADAKGAEAAVLGLPFDLGASNRSGARYGPRAVREMSAHACMNEAAPWEWFARRHIVDCGDTWFFVGDLDHALKRIREDAARILASGARLLAVGGDHTVTYPLLQAQDRKLALIQFDSHDDTGDPYVKPYHGSSVARAVGEGLIDPAHSVLVGLRTPPSESLGIRVLDMDWLDEQGPRACAAAIRETVGGAPAYLTFDIDFLDPSVAPGTGTPVPGGATVREARRILKGLQGLSIVGADLVEVCPPFDGPGQITALAGAFLAVWMLELLLTTPTTR